MKHGSQVEWALHCVTMLAGLGTGDKLSGPDLAELFEVPPQYLAKALQALTHAGIIESSPGRSGGYSLAQHPGRISLIDVIDAVEGREPLFRCQEIRRRGPCRTIKSRHFSGPCQLAAAMQRAEQAWRGELERVSIADINQEVADNVSPTILRVLTEWVETKRR